MAFELDCGAEFIKDGNQKLFILNNLLKEVVITSQQVRLCFNLRGFLRCDDVDEDDVRQ